MTFDLSTVSYAIASLCLIALLGAQLTIWSRGVSSFVLLGATSMSLVWSLFLLFQSSLPIQSFFLIPLIEIAKNVAWFTLLLSLLGIRKVIFRNPADKEDYSGLSLIAVVSIGIPLLLSIYILIQQLVNETIIFLPGFGGRLVILGFLLMAIIGLALMEQVVRNTRQHHRWHLKFLCLGLGVLFSFDIYLYSNALLFERIPNTLWQIRGGIIILAVPLIAIGVVRTRQRPIQVNISRQLVFHTGVLLVAGVYLMLMASAGYYIRNFSGEWGNLLQAVFWIISLSFLVVLLYSGRVRSTLKLYINRHLFSSKYDYRDEWMRISAMLSQTSVDDSLPERVILALAAVVESPSGGIWLSTNNIHFDQVAHVEMGWIEHSALTSNDYLIQHLQDTNRLIDLSDPNSSLDPVLLPEWLSGLHKVWLIIPLQLHDKLIGFVLLKESRVDFELNWEDYDLLKAAGQQAASYLAQMIASDSLSETRQFSAFNQVSAFVVHDIKTLNSQLSMMVRNAEKFKTNPSFIEDMIKTTDHAVKKMNVLLQHFKSKEGGGKGITGKFDLVEVLSEIVRNQSAHQPTPEFICAADSMRINANLAELESAIKHLIQNAQEATEDEGSVVITLSRNNDWAEISVKDNGRGMSREFINSRLFKPFESTKGLTGMGIGVFQSRATIRNLGGNLTVKSESGVGSEFLITIPLNQTTQDN